MDLKFLVGEKSIELKAERNGERLLLSTAGEQRELTVTECGHCEYLLRVGEQVHRVVAVKNGSAIHVLTDNESYLFELPAGKDGDGFGAEHGDHGDKSKIAAPMPGKVVKVLVKPGDKVAPKQKLVIVEAMKMENPLIAPFAAEVKAVNCADGELVDSDRVLIELAKLE